MTTKPSKVNLLKGEFECCGTLCDKRKAQLQINLMQTVINKCNKYFSNAVYFSPKFDKLAKELKELADD